MTSSCTSALACSSSSAAQARTSASSSGRLGADRAVAPVAERRPEPLAAGRRGARRLDAAARRRRRAGRAGRPARRRRRRAPPGRRSRKPVGVPGGASRHEPSRPHAVDDRGRTAAPVSCASAPWPRRTRGRRIGDLLAAGERSFSFEFFPPKDEAGEEQLWRAIRELEPLQPDVRLGDLRRRRQHPRPHRRGSPSGSPRETSLTPMAHLTCVGHTARRAARGSSAPTPTPASATCWPCAATRRTGPGAPWSRTEGGFDYAVELVALVARARRLLRRRRGLPRGAPRRARRSTTTRAVLRRQGTTPARSSRSPRCSSAPSDYFGARRAGRAPPASTSRSSRASCRSRTSRQITPDGRAVRARRARRGRRPVAPLDDDPAAVRAEGIAIATELCDELLAGGAPGLHFYTLNRSKATREIYAALRARRV